MPSFGDTIRRLRDDSAMSASDLARELGTDRRTIDRWEAGTSNPQPRMLRAVAAYFDAWEELGLRRPGLPPESGCIGASHMDALLNSRLLETERLLMQRIDALEHAIMDQCCPHHHLTPAGKG